MKRYTIKRTKNQQVFDWISVEAESPDDAKKKAKSGDGEVVHEEFQFSSIESCVIEEIEEFFDEDVEYDVELG